MAEFVLLRPLTVGELLDKAFRIYRSKFLTLVGITALIYYDLRTRKEAFDLEYLAGQVGQEAAS